MHVYFSGRVQGVGFRYTTKQISTHFEVYGWVKNLSDGRVELLAEGEKSELKSFLNEIKTRMKHYISDIKLNFEPASNKYNSFDIVY
jgi:acylphosphatase